MSTWWYREVTPGIAWGLAGVGIQNSRAMVRHSQASPRASSHAVATVAARCATSIGTLGITMGAAIESAIDVAWLEPVLAAAADVHAAAM